MPVPWGVASHGKNRLDRPAHVRWSTAVLLESLGIAAVPNHQPVLFFKTPWNIPKNLPIIKRGVLNIPIKGFSRIRHVWLLEDRVFNSPRNWELVMTDVDGMRLWGHSPAIWIMANLRYQKHEKHLSSLGDIPIEIAKILEASTARPVGWPRNNQTGEQRTSNSAMWLTINIHQYP